MLGKAFGNKRYVLTVLKDVEDEVHRNSTLSFKFPWFDEEDLAAERIAAKFRLSADEKERLAIAQSVLHGSVVADVARYLENGRSPPSPVDCRVLAFGQIRPAVVVTDDLGMHLLAEDFEIEIWHGPQLLAKMLAAKMVDRALVRGIYEALETNGDLTATWREARHTTFLKIFGATPGA